jgi:hypothetical protein
MIFNVENVIYIIIHLIFVFSMKVQSKQTFITAMIGKLPSQLLRLSGIIQMIHEAYDYTVKSSFQHLSQEFSFSLEDDLKNNSSLQKKISKDNIIRGYKLLTYFNKTKLVLAGFDTDWDLPFDIIIENISLVTMSDEKLIYKVCKYILKSKKVQFDLSAIQQSLKGNGTKIGHVKRATTLLESFDIGKYIQVKNLRGTIYIF